MTFPVDFLWELQCLQMQQVACFRAEKQRGPVSLVSRPGCELAQAGLFPVGCSWCFPVLWGWEQRLAGCEGLRLCPA